jgi:hypothetical protein
MRSGTLVDAGEPDSLGPVGMDEETVGPEGSCWPVLLPLLEVEQPASTTAMKLATSTRGRGRLRLTPNAVVVSIEVMRVGWKDGEVRLVNIVTVEIRGRRGDAEVWIRRVACGRW